MIGQQQQMQRIERDSSPQVLQDRPMPLILKGTLSYNEVYRRYFLRGMWNYESGAHFPAQRFELSYSLDAQEDPAILPKIGVFHGTFSLADFRISAKGSGREKSKVIHEKDVHIYFKKKEGKEDKFDVNGKGTNQFGAFSIDGTATRDVVDKELQYKVELRKKYITPPLAADNPPPSEKIKKGKKGEKRKISGISDKGENQTIDLPQDINSASRSSSDRQMFLRHRQQRLLLLRHAAKCPHEDGQCPVTPHCADMKRLWKHLAECKDKKCQVPHCVSSRSVLSHYHRCKVPRCLVCGPVREAIHRSYKKQKLDAL